MRAKILQYGAPSAKLAARLPALTDLNAGGAAQADAAQSSPNTATVYGASYCEPCKLAKKALEEKGISVRFVDIYEDEDGFDELSKKLSAIGLQPGTIPVIEYDGKISIGFNAAAGKQTKAPQTSIAIDRARVASGYDWRYPATVGVGVVGGATIGYWAFEHAFKNGMSRDEKRQIAGFSLAMSVLYLTSQMPWGKWFNVDTASEELEKVVSG